MKSTALISTLMATTISQEVIVINSPNMFPESIDFDTTKSVFYAGSTTQGTISAVSLAGDTSTFISDPDITESGYGILGVQVDSISRILIACVFEFNFTNPNAFAGVAAYDIDTKERKFLSRLSDSGERGPFLCNDLVLDGAGLNAFVTDSIGDRIFKVC